MAAVPLGAELNLALQTLALALLAVSLLYGWRAHRILRKDPDAEPPEEETHGKYVESAVVIASIGAAVWMIPNFLLGWEYGTASIGYGNGGYTSYFVSHGVLLPHWYLIALHVPIGVLSGALAVYLWLRMEVKSFPKRFAIKRHHALMVFTFIIWFLNAVIGFAIFYFYILAGTG